MLVYKPLQGLVRPMCCCSVSPVVKVNHNSHTGPIVPNVVTDSSALFIGPKHKKSYGPFY